MQNTDQSLSCWKLGRFGHILSQKSDQVCWGGDITSKVNRRAMKTGQHYTDVMKQKKQISKTETRQQKFPLRMVEDGEEGNHLLLTLPIFPLRFSQAVCHESHSPLSSFGKEKQQTNRLLKSQRFQSSPFPPLGPFCFKPALAINCTSPGNSGCCWRAALITTGSLHIVLIFY